ncbi:hypothetical protein LXA43DRAFT_975618 [Ganoderma leucocontextum]|nr:hypothetical protein LXA43DRAFT_975618 [Ganoderma leucocontextum]
MSDCSPTLPLFNDGRGTFTTVQALRDADDNIIAGHGFDTVFGGALTAEPAGETAEQSESSSILSYEGVYIAAAPVLFISRLRYQRREVLDYDKIQSYNQIGPKNSFVPERQLPSADCKWVRHVHPEGSVYFQQENWFTNLWLYDEQNLKDINATMHLVSLEFRRCGLAPSGYEICLDIDIEDDEETERGRGLEDRPAQLLTLDHRDHIYMFPHGRTLTIEQLHMLRADITYYMFDKKTSRASTAPYNKDDLNDLLDILKEIEALMRGMMSSSVDQKTRPQHVVVVGRLTETLCRERFMRFHGERYAQLDSDRSVYEDRHRERSLLFNVLTWMFFFTPSVYFEQLSRIWVDRKINYDRWRSFIGDLQDDWMASITPSAVILTANVGFLAIQSVDANGDPIPDRSMGQIVSYMSTMFSIGNILACTILAWQHRRSEHHYAEDAVDVAMTLAYAYLVPRASSRLGIEKLAIIFSIPMTFFLLALLTFCIAISWVCFHGTNPSTRVISAITLLIIAIPLFGIIHNREWQPEQSVNSLAGNIARMKKLVKEARRRSFQRWTTLSGTLDPGRLAQLDATENHEAVIALVETEFPQ